MEDFDYDILETVLKIIAFIVVIVVAILGCTKCDNDKWNDGQCPNCGTAWRYEQAVGHRYTTHYIYVCDTCGRRIEVDYIRNPSDPVEHQVDSDTDSWVTEET